MTQRSNLDQLFSLLGRNRIQYGVRPSDVQDEIIITVHSPLAARIEVHVPADAANAPAMDPKTKTSRKTMQNRNDFVQRFSDLRLGIRPDPGHREDLKHKILNDRFGNVVEIFRTDKEGSHAVMMQDVFEDREITLDLMTVMAEANIRFFEDVLRLIDKFFYSLDMDVDEIEDLDEINLDAYRGVLLSGLPTLPNYVLDDSTFR